MSLSLVIKAANRRQGSWLWWPFLLVVLLFLLVGRGQSDRLTFVEHAVHDQLTSLFLYQSSINDPRVVVVDIDEASLSKFGRWPWPRELMGQMFSRLLEDYQVSLIGSDVLFVDEVGQPEVNPPVFADPRVINAVVWSEFNQEQKGTFSNNQVQLLSGLTGNGIHPPLATGWLAPADENWGRGHISPYVSPDGIVRKMAPLACNSQGQCLESLALGLYRSLLNVLPNYVLKDGLLSLDLGMQSLPVADVNARGYAWVGWTGYATADMYVSAADILQGVADKSRLAGKIVLVGSTSTGLYDQIAAPFAPVYPAVEVHRNQLSSLLEGRLDKTIDWGRGLEFGLSLLVVFIMWVGFAFERLSIGAAVAFLLVVCHALLVVVGRFEQQYWSFAYFWLVFGLYGLLMLAIRPRLERLRRLQLVKRFGVYVAPQVLERLQREGVDTVGVYHQRSEVTALFADVRGYTQFSEQVSAPELARVTRLLMNELTEVVLQYEGTVDKYMGDSIMAFWGAPVAQEKHPDKAFKAGLEMLRRVEQLNASGRLPGFKIGVGINTGDAVVGDLGSDFRYDYSIIGASVNLASYLEEGTRNGPYDLIVGTKTFMRSETARAMPHKQLNVHAKGLQHLAYGFTVLG